MLQHPKEDANLVVAVRNPLAAGEVKSAAASEPQPTPAA
jgi:hypothetical protein